MRSELGGGGLPNQTDPPFSPLTSQMLIQANLTTYMCANQTADPDAPYGVKCVTAHEYGDAAGYFYDGNLALDPVRVPAYTELDSQEYSLLLLSSFSDLLELINEEKEFGVALSKVNGSVLAQVGDLIVPVLWDTEGIPLYINGSRL
jgi:hypothetical protein